MLTVSRFTRLLAGSAFALTPLAQAAEAPPAADQARIRAAIIISAFDELHSRCAAGYTPEQRTEVQRWLARQDVDRVRAHLRGAGLSAALRAQTDAAAAQLIRQVAANANPCVAATSLTRTAEARFAEQLPLLLGGPATPARAPTPTPPPPQTAKLAADIEGFAFDSCTRMGYGGMVMFVPCPVVLFRDGVALTDVEELGEVRSVAAHRQTKPASWTPWRRQGGKIQLLKDQTWDSLTYTAVYASLPPGFRLDGRFRSMNGAGNTALGGGEAVAAWTDYLFRPDGSMQRDAGAGASSSSTGVAVTASARAAARTGRYRIDGLVLVIDYDDGGSERRVIIADPRDQGRGTLWLDGEGYVLRP